MHELLHPRMRIQHNNSLVTPIDFVIVSRSPSRSKMASFSVEAMVRGYHVYQDIWTAVIGEEFPYKREAGNTFDPFAVAVTRGDTNIVIGHVPRRISTVCSLFLRKEGSITCQVTGHRRFSEDLVQGGLEIPCVLRFDGDTKVTAKAKKLVEAALSTSTAVCCPASKKRKVTDVPSILPDTGKDASSEEWVRYGRRTAVNTVASKASEAMCPSTSNSCLTRLSRRSKVASHLNFRLFKILQFLISYVQRAFEIYENLHHMNISRYTVSLEVVEGLVEVSVDGPLPH